MRNRRDAKRIKMDGMHNLMWHIKPERRDSDVYINKKIDVTNLVKYVVKKKKENSDFTYFHAFSTAIGKTIYNRHRLNRFLLNSHYYERNDISLSFVAKTEFKDDAPEFFAFLKVNPEDNVNIVSKKILEQVKSIRTNNMNSSDNVVNSLGNMPRIIRAFVIWLFRRLDDYDLLPKSLIETDIYHSTIILSNLGSIKCGAIYHNLTDFGTNSILMTIGEIKKEPVVDKSGNIAIHDMCDFGINLDERIADGAYFAKSFNLFEKLLQSPNLLEDRIDETIPEI